MLEKIRELPLTAATTSETLNPKHPKRPLNRKHPELYAPEALDLNPPKP